MCNESKVKSIRPDVNEYGTCNLPKDTEEYSKIVFEYNVNDTSELCDIKEKIQSIPGVKSANICNDLDSILFQMNRTAYYNVRKY